MIKHHWDERYLEMADLVASWSKDRSTQVGCVIVGSAGQILSTGYNGFPRGIDDGVDSRHERPVKYAWTEHAERNAIYNASRTGTSLEGSACYISWFPSCPDCTRGIIQSGIAVVVYGAKELDKERWESSFQISTEMLYEAKVQIRKY